MKKFEIIPIGVIHSPYKTKKDIPINPSLNNKNEFVLEIFDEYLEGAEDIEVGGYYDILFVFHQIDKYALKQHQHGNANLPIKGVFSIRSPRRPNFIGVTKIKVDRFEKKKIIFFGGDMLDGTPIVDIKPSIK